jgi:hypothetical protein
MMHMKTGEENSQMKGESVVVAITDHNNTPFREHDFRKGQTPGGPNACKVYIPFNSEYKILLKNQNSCRIKIEAELDGTNITDSGLILGAFSTIYLERFLGGDGNKFLFVPVESDAVGDPTSKENGILRIKVAKEKAIEIVKKTVEHHHHHHDWWTYKWPNIYPYDNTYYYRSSGECNDILGNGRRGLSANDMVGMNASYSCSNAPQSLNYCSNTHGEIDGPTLSDLNVKSGGAVGQAGATVEGSKSDQKFSTTDWNGDTGTAYTFVFKLLGVAGQLSEQDKKDYAEMLRLQEKFGKK